MKNPHVFVISTNPPVPNSEQSLLNLIFHYSIFKYNDMICFVMSSQTVLLNSHFSVYGRNEPGSVRVNPVCDITKLATA